ncbi:sugar phosphate isomerase/epimerase family protein [Kibdelosporangium aridum]|uniref:sugar phosphate isomerase/epimerase family protein n=1 Tax=Kibdelosporangium aridum TaxID=2030 RepID=UPI00052597E4
MRHIGVNTWVWTSPLTDEALHGLAPKIAGWGFDTIEMPVENPGDWAPDAARTLLDDLGLSATVVLVMPPGRELVRADAGTVTSTQDYLRSCVDVATKVGSPVIAGPAYTSVGRTWRATDVERKHDIIELRENLGPVLDHAKQAGVTIAVEPLNRYETSLLNTVNQTLEALAGLPSCGVALDFYHQNIEETDIPAAIRAATGRIAHVQVCANDRGTPGRDHLDWRAMLTTLDDAGYDGPLCIESFTAHNASIATAASIWRPLATSQDDLAADGLAFLKSLL